MPLPFSLTLANCSQFSTNNRGKSLPILPLLGRSLGVIFYLVSNPRPSKQSFLTSIHNRPYLVYYSLTFRLNFFLHQLFCFSSIFDCRQIVSTSFNFINSLQLMQLTLLYLAKQKH